MQQKTITLYNFDELSEHVQETVLENLYSLNIDHEWWDCTFQDAKEMGLLLGIEVDDIFFSGFSSQGDGACFEGSYAYAKGCAKEIRKYAPQDETLHDLADRLVALQKPFFYCLTARVSHSGNYYHELSTDINIYAEMNTGREFFVSEATENELNDILRGFMSWLYRQLEKDHDYRTSPEAIKECIEANEYQFRENGDIE